MEDENKIETAEEASLKARRKFLKTAAGVAVTAPAVTMLLAAPTKSFAGSDCNVIPLAYGEPAQAAISECDE